MFIYGETQDAGLKARRYKGAQDLPLQKALRVGHPGEEEPREGKGWDSDLGRSGAAALSRKTWEPPFADSGWRGAGMKARATRRNPRPTRYRYVWAAETKRWPWRKGNPSRPRRGAWGMHGSKDPPLRDWAAQGAIVPQVEAWRSTDWGWGWYWVAIGVRGGGGENGLCGNGLYLWFGAIGAYNGCGWLRCA